MPDDIFEVLEMHRPNNAARMELAELERFCKERRLPLFTIKIDEISLSGSSTPYRKCFTLLGDWCFWAAETIKETALEQEAVQ